ncbi:MAG: hypothetical protein HKM89_13400 [Gemmatimonadales bacterium]|nr:hypothetical protein [Gemmatimonadales bacterium]
MLKHYRDPPALELHADGVSVLRTARQELDSHWGTLTHHDTFTWQEADGQTRELGKTPTHAMIGFAEIALFLADLGFTDVQTFNSFADRSLLRWTARS